MTRLVLPVSGPQPRTAGLLGLCLTAAAVVLMAGGAIAQGVGDRIPTIRFKTTAGESGRLVCEGGSLTLNIAGKQTNPKALLVHFLQPDCLQCEAEALALDVMSADCGSTGAVILGMAHRGNAGSVAAFRDRLKLDYPVLVLEADDASTKLAAGDATRIVDRTGVIRFAQAGFGDGDQRTWRDAIQALIDGREVTATAPARAVLKAGDRMPVIELPALIGDGKLALRGTEGGLAFEDTQGRVTRPSAAVGFFSRYWDFSREEMVHLQKIHESLAARGVLVFVIAMHPDADEARKLTRELGVTYPVFQGHGSGLGDLYAYGWPAYVLDAGGVIRHTQVGFEAGDEATYIKTLHEILDGSKKPEGAVAAPAAWPTATKAAHTGPAQKLLFYTTAGTTTPHDTVLPFVFAVKASEKGHRPLVFLAGDATLLAKDGVRDAVRAPGQPDVATLWKRAMELKIPIFL